jgi:hypothetical protein
MTEPVDNLDVKKKELEIEKLQKEITKLERESTELRWRKWSNWGAAIIAICSVAIVGLNGYLIDSKAKLVKEETLNQQAKNNKLISQKSKIQKQLDSLEQKFIQDKLKFDKERVKYGYVISQKENEIGGLRNEKSELLSEKTKIEDCLIKAKEFLKYCIRYNEQPEKNNPEVYNAYLMGATFPYKTRFIKPLEEISKMDISKMDYLQFLENAANFRREYNYRNLTNDIVSQDSIIRIPISANYGNITVQRTPHKVGEIRSQFECYKSFSNTQKLKLLKQMIVRPY